MTATRSIDAITVRDADVRPPPSRVKRPERPTVSHLASRDPPHARVRPPRARSLADGGGKDCERVVRLDARAVASSARNERSQATNR